MQKLEGYILATDPETKTFILRTHGDIVCKYSTALEAKQYQSVSMTGSYENNIFIVDTMQSRDLTMTDEIMRTYRKMANTITNPRSLNKLAQKYVSNEPRYVKKLLLLAGTESELTISCFLSEYSQICKGATIHVYRLTQQDIQDIESVLTKFTDYDVTAFLCEDMTDLELCLLSSRENIKYLLNKKNKSYLTVVRSPGKLSPLIEHFCKTFDANEDLIRMIKTIQDSEQSQIQQLKCLLQSDARTIVHKFQSRLEKYRATHEQRSYGLIRPNQIQDCLKSQIMLLRVYVADYSTKVLLSLAQEPEKVEPVEIINNEEPMLILESTDNLIDESTSDDPKVEESPILEEAAQTDSSNESLVVSDTDDEMTEYTDSESEELQANLFRDCDEEYVYSPSSYWADKYLFHNDYFRSNPHAMLLAHHAVYNLCQEIKNTKK